MSKPSRKRAEAILWRGQKVPQEWAITRDCEDLIQRARVAAEVDARTNGLCYYEGCGERINAYPHAVPFGEGGTHDAINRVGVCGIHVQAMRHGHDPRGKIRRHLQQWIQRWYTEQNGMTSAEWWIRAVRPGRRKGEQLDEAGMG